MAGHSCGKYANSWRKYAGISRFNPFPCLNMAKGKIIVMRLFGGLGNQLFQYAFLFALSRQGGKQDWKPHHMNMMIRGSANSITSGFPFPLKEALPPGLSASPVFPPACVPCSPLPNILISGRKTARVRSRSRGSSPPPYLFQGIFSDGTILPPLPGTALQGIPSENSPDSGKRPHS